MYLQILRYLLNIDNTPLLLIVTDIDNKFIKISDKSHHC